MHGQVEMRINTSRAKMLLLIATKVVMMEMSDLIYIPPPTTE
jgi:hypothetical protein